jgi:tRNA threonylcarbamoyladenosine biosynthesis protein TsaB
LLLLTIETASRVCSVALARDGTIIGTRESSAPNAHSAVLTIFISELLAEAGIQPAALDAVAVSMGPGSYTGLRIGVATAKGLCYAIDKPMIAVPTLLGMAKGMQPACRTGRDAGYRMQETPLLLKEKGLGDEVHPLGDELLFVPMLDARRMEVYCAVYDSNLAEIMPTEAKIIDENSFADLLSAVPVIFAGEGAEKCRTLLGEHPNAQFIQGFEASAKYLVPQAMERYKKGQFENLAYFEPFYLKDFVAGKPRVKGLR